MEDFNFICTGANQIFSGWVCLFVVAGLYYKQPVEMVIQWIPSPRTHPSLQLAEHTHSCVSGLDRVDRPSVCMADCPSNAPSFEAGKVLGVGKTGCGYQATCYINHLQAKLPICNMLYSFYA